MTSALVVVVKNSRLAMVSKQCHFGWLALLAFLAAFSPSMLVHSNATAQTVKKKSKKKSSGERELEKYFTGGKNKSKISKEKDKRGKKDKKKSSKESEGIVDTKAILGQKGSTRTSGGNIGTNTSKGYYRPVYVGNKVVTGSIEQAQGFRICIYNGNNRQEAMAQKVKFMKAFPGIRTYLVYVVPSYKIKVGDFADKKIAQKELKKIEKQFPTSFVLPDVVTVKNIMIYKK